MTLYKLKSAQVLLIEDDIEKNIKPLLLELSEYSTKNVNLHCYEQPIQLWKNVFMNNPNVKYYEDMNVGHIEKYKETNCCIIVDSINQMALSLGWSESLKFILSLKKSKMVKLILVLHKDCLLHLSKLQSHLRHIASAIVSYDSKDNNKISVVIKKNNKVFRSEEKLFYDLKTNILKLAPITKDVTKEEIPEKISPGNLTTFKIEVDQIGKMEKYKLKLPYMSKINEGESKIIYEPDAADDWDEEDPDEDLDI